jgi:hypothetical protein
MSFLQLLLLLLLLLLLSLLSIPGYPSFWKEEAPTDPTAGWTGCNDPEKVRSTVKKGRPRSPEEENSYSSWCSIFV